MAAMNRFDSRLDSLVVETRTEFADEIADELTEDDRAWLVDVAHGSPEQASQIRYERAHTGFTRIILLTKTDLARIYNERQQHAAS
ncbi:hypothetical protein [Stratiformator vulcanicus]|uniref:Uncharacterized protein n=1 Tax=Stratiformator vulcanicus TaxID=2527980 RepID=A0A517R545_9PLAN|nr:hypothetical protein [Stratiformator vulcanicus]QDT39017.1 hypothetical protein Pan189_34180 [Stratiformator vulcanicus]